MSVKNQSKTGPISTKNEKMEMAVFVVSSYIWILLNTYLVRMLLSAWAPVQDSLVSLSVWKDPVYPSFTTLVMISRLQIPSGAVCLGADPAYKLSAECHNKISLQFLVGAIVLKNTLPSTISFRLRLVWKNSGKWKVGRSYSEVITLKSSKLLGTCHPSWHNVQSNENKYYP